MIPTIPVVASINSASRVSGTAQFSFTAPASAADVFELVTPEGERRWDPSWNPRYITAAHGAVGTVFETGAPSGLHVWLVDRADVVQRRIRYVVIRPGTALLTIDVAVRPLTQRKAQVFVRYYGVALTAAADSNIKMLSVQAVAMAHEWQRAFERALAGRR